jgi:hypothetical protein
VMMGALFAAQIISHYRENGGKASPANAPP